MILVLVPDDKIDTFSDSYSGEVCSAPSRSGADTRAKERVGPTCRKSNRKLPGQGS